MLIFSDIDGTLINDRFQVTARTQQAIVAAVQEGHRFIPVSARMPEAILPIVADFLPQTPIVSYNGAYIQDENGKALAFFSMDVTLCVAICQLVEEQYPQLAWNAYCGNYWFSKDKSNPFIRREEEIVGVASEQMTVEELAQQTQIHKLLLMGDEQVIQSLQNDLSQQYPQLSIATSHPTYLEIMAQGIHKGQAVEFFMDYYGVSRRETMAFGDNFNDLDMLEAVENGYVMANGPQAVQEKIGRVTKSNNEDGIACVLEELVR